VSLLFAQESCTCLTVLVLLCYPAEANVIYLETPAGVGYSYSADAAYYQGVDDNMTGTDVFVLLSSLFIYFPKKKLGMFLSSPLPTFSVSFASFNLLRSVCLGVMIISDISF
jgi:hypothetical protein